MGLITALALGSSLVNLGSGVYSMYKSADAMKQYNAGLQSRMALNDAKISEAQSPELSAVGQNYLTQTQDALKTSTDQLKGIDAVNGGGLDSAKAKSVYGDTLGRLVGNLYANDYALKQQRLNALEGYNNALYAQYLQDMGRQGQQNALAASSAFGNMGSSLSGLIDKKAKA